MSNNYGKTQRSFSKPSLVFDSVAHPAHAGTTGLLIQYVRLQWRQISMTSETTLETLTVPGTKDNFSWAIIMGKPKDPSQSPRYFLIPECNNNRFFHLPPSLHLIRDAWRHSRMKPWQCKREFFKSGVKPLKPPSPHLTRALILKSLFHK